VGRWRGGVCRSRVVGCWWVVVVGGVGLVGMVVLTVGVSEVVREFWFPVLLCGGLLGLIRVLDEVDWNDGHDGGSQAYCLEGKRHCRLRCHGTREPKRQLPGDRFVPVDTLNMRQTTCVGNKPADTKDMKRMACAGIEPAEKILKSSFVGLLSGVGRRLLIDGRWSMG
jgi:hypothetical protein